MSLKELVLDNFTLIFYAVVLLIVFINRKKFEIQGKIIALYKTTVGLDLMKKIGTKHKYFVRLLGLIGIGVGFIGMMLTAYLFIRTPFDVITRPAGQAGVAPVIPGVNIPGSPVFVPLIAGWLAIFVIMVVHEFSHGVVSIAHDVPVKSSGIVFIGPIMGAFVEPDEEEIKKKRDHTKYSIFAAGPFSNIILSGIVALVMYLLISPVSTAMSGQGLTFDFVEPDSPADRAGLQPGMTIAMVNNITITDTLSFYEELETVKPGEKILLSTQENIFTVETVEHSDIEGRAYIGISGISRPLSEKFSFLSFIQPLTIIQGINTFLFWLFWLSLGIGLANLLPLPITDGGRMVWTALMRMQEKEKADKTWKYIALVFIVVTLSSLVLTLAKGLHLI